MVWGSYYYLTPMSTQDTKTFRLAGSPQITTGVRLRTLLCDLIVSLQKMDLAVKGHTNHVPPRFSKMEHFAVSRCPAVGFLFFFPLNEPNKLSEQNVLFKYGSTSVSISYF